MYEKDESEDGFLASTKVISLPVDDMAFPLSFPRSLATEWYMTVLSPDAVMTPRDLPQDTQWHRAPVPGTALKALELGGVLDVDQPLLLHNYDVWYRAQVRLTAGDKLKFRGLAGLSEIWVDDEQVASSATMFVELTLPPAKGGEALLSIRFRSLTTCLKTVSGRPRWRTKLVESNGLRKQRQTLLGHMPGWCPPFHAVGPYRSVDWSRGPGTLETCTLYTVTRGRNAVLSVYIVFGEAINHQAQLYVRIGSTSILLNRQSRDTFSANVTLDNVELWWPHTHGNPALYEVFLTDGTSELHLGNVGFRDLKVSRGNNSQGFQLQVNGLSIFCRGACWTNADLLGLQHDRQAYREWLELARDAGMNMIRVSGVMLYESKVFYDLCDELGIFVWQDLIFANLDYSTNEAVFRNIVVKEVEQLVDCLAGGPSFAVLCGGSEIAQQSAMLGLHNNRRSTEFFETFIPNLIRNLRSDLVYVANSPWGGPLPMNVSAGIAHYYGVGAYQRPLEEARRANVSFVTECLAFANPAQSNSPAAKCIMKSPQDPGTSWSFADTRDHYLRTVYLVDPARLRAEDPHRYFDLSRAVTADVMEAVFSEWRQPRSSCTGALVWQLQDLAPGSGWGVIDSSGHPKAAWYGLRRVLAPIQVLVSDEKTDGLEVHLINETPSAIAAVVELTCFKNGSIAVITGKQDVTLSPRSSLSLSSHTLLDYFFDITRTYRFGPAEHNVTVVTLRSVTSGKLLSEAFHFPTDRLLPLDDLGMVVNVLRDQIGWIVEISTVRFAQAVHFELDYYTSSVDWFHLPPSETRQVRLLPFKETDRYPTGVVSALNGRKKVLIQAAP